MQHLEKEPHTFDHPDDPSLGRKRHIPTLRRQAIERKPVLLCTEAEIVYLETLDLLEAYPAHLDVVLHAIEEVLTSAQCVEQP